MSDSEWIPAEREWLETLTAPWQVWVDTFGLEETHES